MFNAGEFVIYGSEGVCRIKSISQQTFGGESAEYYELVPKFNPNTSVFVPADNEKLTSKMMPLLSRDEMDELISAIPDIPTEWIENENMRKERYKQMLSSGDRRDLVCILKTIYIHKQECIQKGRKLHACDEKFFTEASDKLHCEVAAVMEISPIEAEEYILKKMQP